MDPLKDVEDANAQRNLGAVAFRIYAGARGEGASVFEAFMMVVAWFRGSIGATDDKLESEEDE